MKRKPLTVRGLEDLGRTRLSRHFFLRDFLCSEIGIIHGIANVPDDPDRAIASGARLCQELLDPLHDTFGQVSIRSGYRSAALNAFGNQRGYGCARNDNPDEAHIWDKAGGTEAAACATVVLPWFADQYARGRDWRDLAWWIHDHLPYSELWFFPRLAAFNLTWRAEPWRKISSYIAPRGTLLARGAEPVENHVVRAARYVDFPELHRPAAR